jgi:hypothetical protein
VDFDSTIRRFESSRPSQVSASEISSLSNPADLRSERAIVFLFFSKLTPSTASARIGCAGNTDSNTTTKKTSIVLDAICEDRILARFFDSLRNLA